LELLYWVWSDWGWFKGGSAESGGKSWLREIRHSLGEESRRDAPMGIQYPDLASEARIEIAQPIDFFD